MNLRRHFENLPPPTLAESVVEAALLAMLATPAARVMLDRGVRRRFAAFPPVPAVLTSAVLMYGAALVALVVLAPVVLRWLSAAALIALAWHSWQGRRSFGRDRGLPPGSLRLLPRGPWRDPHYYKKASELDGPVFKFRHFVEPAVGIVGLARIADFLKSNDGRLAVPPAPFNAVVPGGFVRYIEGAEHARIATALRTAFTARVIGCSAGDFRGHARVAVEAISSGKPLTPTIDAFVFASMMSSFLGIQTGSQFDRFRTLFADSDYRRLGSTGRNSARHAVHEIILEMRNLARQRVERPTFLSELVTAQPDALDSDEILGNFAYALHTGRIDCASMLVWVVAVMGENPSLTRQVRVLLASDDTAAGRLADRIVRETLRLRQSEFLLRRTTAPIEFGGYTIPAGWHVRMCIAESHRLAKEFERPEQFDPDRFIATSGRPKYAPFGFPPHRCPGDHIARALGQHFVRELARGYDIVANDVEPWEFSGFHWRPNSRMSVHLRSSGA